MKHTLLLVCLFTGFLAKADIPEKTIQATISDILTKGETDKTAVEAGVRQAARLWQTQDGTDAEFHEFCVKNYISDPAQKQQVFQKASNYFEALWGHFNEITLQLQLNLHQDNGPLHDIDPMFGAYSPGSHLINDFYDNKIGFIIALNFPEVPLQTKEKLGKDRTAWAYARLGDVFTQRVPAELIQAGVKAESDADVYISSYNIYMGHVLNAKGQKLFPEDKILLTHWNLRDEIKANYNKGKEGLDKQRTVYEVMKQIISQNIPTQVINSGAYDWNPYTNTLTQNGQTVMATPEATERYQRMLNNFHAMKAIDPYAGKNFIDRKFSGEMEVSVDDVKALFTQFLTSPELKEVGKIISKRLGRKLEAYDIWYDGFKPRSNLDETKLDAQIQKLYPNAEAFKAGLPALLTHLEFTPERANEICDKIAVDAARGSGHAWGAAMKGQQSHLRTRIPAEGMNYKGYNIAVHEFGHNVEQTISMYNVDNFMMAGVPNTAFTEALAFVFQKRDLKLLGIENNDPEADKMDILDKFWSLYEIMGVSMLDISIWEWLYANPDATADQLREATISLSKEIWNKYYAPVFGKKDETVLAIYSHMISYPLYLSAYAFGQIIEFQLEDYLGDKNFAQEVDRIYRLGRLTPNEWMIQATGNDLSVEPLIHALQKVIKK